MLAVVPLPVCCESILASLATGVRKRGHYLHKLHVEQGIGLGDDLSTIIAVDEGMFGCLLCS